MSHGENLQFVEKVDFGQLHSELESLHFFKLPQPSRACLLASTPGETTPMNSLHNPSGQIDAV
jgi:hypothetical protein